MDSFVLIIAGGTASGKTTITASLLSALKHHAPSLLAVDSYYFPLSHLSFEERELINFDHPQQFEISLLKEHLAQLISGESITTPIYNYTLHNREPVGHVVAPSRIIVVEGIMALHYPELQQLASFKVFVDAPDEIRLERRIKRDIAERGRTQESVLTWWDEKVHPMHLQFCQPSKAVADLIVSGTTPIEDSVERIMTDLRAKNII